MIAQTTVATTRWKMFGRHDGRTVAVLGGISAGRAVCNEQGIAGWWGNIAGDGCAIDTRTTRVIGIDYLGSELTRDDSPQIITTRDQAEALASVLDVLGIARLHALVGSSYGGMVALAFASLFPERVGRLVVFGAADRPHPMATAVRTVQRRIVALAVAAGRPDEGVALARALAMTTYRTPDELAARFTEAGEVEGWLDHHGEKFAAAWTPARYATLSRSIDLHAVDPGTISTPVTLVSFSGDAIAPPAQIRALANRLAGDATLHEIETPYGHDAFLKEAGIVADILKRSLEQDTSS